MPQSEWHRLRRAWRLFGRSGFKTGSSDEVIRGEVQMHFTELARAGLLFVCQTNKKVPKRKQTPERLVQRTRPL
jgi:hypothetical protein